jgi:hypothetical protein
MGLIHDAYENLYPGTEFPYEAKLVYSRKFKGYNANIRLRGRLLSINLSAQWKVVTPEIQIGLIQSLLVKLKKDKKKTSNMDLYHMFLRHVHVSVPKTRTNEILEMSFDRVNEKYFSGLIDKPNLVEGKDSFYRLGTYEYGTDTITISKIVMSSSPEILDYIMYHEMLHKKLKFHDKNGKTFHHTSEFRKKENEFENSKRIEEEIKKLGRKAKKRGFLSMFS